LYFTAEKLLGKRGKVYLCAFAMLRCGRRFWNMYGSDT
jgi:hypothetical protein